MDRLLSTVLKNHTEEVRALLINNGITGADGMGKADLQIAFLKAVKDSASFRADASRFLTSLVQAQSANFSGSYLNLGIWEGEDDIPADNNPIPTKAATDTKAKSSFWDSLAGVASTDNLNKLFGTGLDTLSNSLKAKANRQSEERALELERLRLEQLNVQKDIQSGGGILPGSGMSLGAKIAIGVGVAGVVGIIIYLAVKK